MADAKVKSGATTSEHAQAKSGSMWGIIGIVLGILTTTGATVAASMGADSKWGIVAGALISVAGVTQKTLTDLGYIQSRTQVKAASSVSKGK